MDVVYAATELERSVMSSQNVPGERQVGGERESFGARVSAEIWRRQLRPRTSFLPACMGYFVMADTREGDVRARCLATWMLIMQQCHHCPIAWLRALGLYRNAYATV